MFRKFLAPVLVAGALIGSTAAHAKDILETAGEAGTFSILLAAIKATGLTETLKQPGPITVFAPTDDAFAKLPQPMLEGLLKPENRDRTRQIISYHLVLGRVVSRDFLGKRLEAATAEGGSLLIDATKNVMVDNAKLVKSDIITDNGVIHVLDSVAMPPLPPK